MKDYKTIRSPEQKARCTGGGGLYCDCGCQTPIDSDPTLQIVLEGVKVSRKSPDGYANYMLSRNEEEIGSINIQYQSITIDRREYLGCSKEVVQYLIDQAMSLNIFIQDTNPGETSDETQAIISMQDQAEIAEQDTKYEDCFGYCKKCHSFCYGDCQSY